MIAPPTPTPTQATVKAAISRWGNLLRCSDCGVIASSMADLWEGQLCQTCFCRRSRSDETTTSTSPSLAVLVNGGALDTKSVAKNSGDPGRVLHILRLLLQKMQENEKGELVEEPSSSSRQNINAQQENKNNDDFRVSTEEQRPPSHKYKPSKSLRLHETQSVKDDDDSTNEDEQSDNHFCRRSYASLDFNFFSNPLAPPSSELEDQGDPCTTTTGIVARNSRGGQVYYQGGKHERLSHKRRSAQWQSHKKTTKDETKDADDLVFSFDKEDGETETMRIPTTDTRSEAPVKNRYGNKIPQRSRWGEAVAMKASKNKLTESDLNNPNSYDQIADSDSKDVLEILETKEYICDNRDQQASADSLGHVQVGISTIQESFSTTTIAETADFGKLGNNNYQSSPNDDGQIGTCIEKQKQRVEKSSDDKLLLQRATLSISTALEESVATCALHETADFGNNGNGNAPSQKDEENNMTKNQQVEEEASEPSPREPLPQSTTSGTMMEGSVLTSALPETADFRNQSSPNSSETNMTKNQQMVEEASEPSPRETLPQSTTLSGTMEGSVLTSALPETADFGNFGSPSSPNDSENNTTKNQHIEEATEPSPREVLLQAEKSQQTQTESAFAALSPLTETASVFIARDAPQSDLLRSKVLNVATSRSIPEKPTTLQVLSSVPGGQQRTLPSANAPVRISAVTPAHPSKSLSSSRNPSIETPQPRNIVPSRIAGGARRTTLVTPSNRQLPPSQPVEAQTAEEGNGNLDSSALVNSSTRSPGYSWHSDEIRDAGSQSSDSMTSPVKCGVADLHQVAQYCIDSRLHPQTADFSELASDGTIRDVVIDALLVSDYNMLQSMHENEVCNLLCSAEQESRFKDKTENSMLVQQGIHLLVHYETKPCPFVACLKRGIPADDRRAENQQIQVCFRTFEYLKARAFGWSVVSTSWLSKESSDHLSETQRKGSKIWGDSTLYDQVLGGNSNYAWLQSTDWWNSPCTSPCESSVERIRDKKPLLYSFNIIVVDDGLKHATEAPPIIREETGMPSMEACGHEDALRSSDAVHFQGLCSKDVETLCRPLGSSLLKSVSDSKFSHLVLVPDKIDEEEFVTEIFPKLMKKQTIQNDAKLQTDCRLPTYRDSPVKFVYFSWLADSISADWLAPLRPYCLGFLE